MYKVTDKSGEATEILAAMDAAIEDGVDVLALPLGKGSHPFPEDAIAVGAFAAMSKGIFVVCAAGNYGPGNYSLSNEAPWVLTVGAGAGTVDQSIRATVLLGNDIEYDGESLFQPTDFPSNLIPLVYPGADGNTDLIFCISLTNVDVKGKIVLCEGAETTDLKGQVVKDNGGLAMILMNTELGGFITTPMPHVLPTSHVSYVAGSAIKDYIKSTQSPTATILFKGTVVGTEVPQAPQVAQFSSRGPNTASPGILKPDVVGPGVRVLAAWPDSPDNTSNKYALLSGTSMSCSHLAGITALLKGAHPEWSPAAVKSALMTTADLKNLQGDPISDEQYVEANVFSMGTGHVNPTRAVHPGLVYDVEPEDYLCGMGYAGSEVGLIANDEVVCSKRPRIEESQLNYPTFSIKLGFVAKTFTRTLRNVGPSQSEYTVEVLAPQGVNVKVEPEMISFSVVNEKVTNSVTFQRNLEATGTFSQGYLNWAAQGYGVRSPIAVLFE